VLASQLSLIDRLANYSSSETLLIVDEVHHSNYDAPHFQSVVDRFERTIGLSATPWTDGILNKFNYIYFYSLSSAIVDKVVSPLELITANYLSPLGEYHTIIFVASNAEAKNKSARFPCADWIGHSREDSENLSVINGWRNRTIKILFANRMLLEGYDTPETSTVWIDHSLDSVVMCAQIVGRALRYKPEKKARIYVTCPDTIATVSEAVRRMNYLPR
jgi:superfamily II DNA or RNA helicase